MKNRIFYGWWIVAATNIICMFGYGTWLYSFAVFFKPMSAEFGWTRAMTSGAYALRGVERGVANPIVGWAVDKYGAPLLVIFSKEQPIPHSPNPKKGPLKASGLGATMKTVIEEENLHIEGTLTEIRQLQKPC